MYGPELILDLHGCDVSTFNRKSLRDFCRALCLEIKMEAVKFVSWDDDGLAAEDCQTEPHTKGYSAVQFILTSSIVIHTLEMTASAYVNIFSCKDFDRWKAKAFTKKWFRAKKITSRLIKRI